MANEDLRQPSPLKEVPSVAAGNAGGAMTRDDALELLEAFANYLDAGPTAKHHIKELREIITALSSCACGGEKPLAVVEVRCYKDDRTLNGLHHNLDACFLYHEGACEPVRVLVLPGGKP